MTTAAICAAYEALRPYIAKATGPHRAFLIQRTASALCQEQDSQKVEQIMRLTEFERAKELSE